LTNTQTFYMLIFITKTVYITNVIHKQHLLLLTTIHNLGNNIYTCSINLWT